MIDQRHGGRVGGVRRDDDGGSDSGSTYVIAAADLAAADLADGVADGIVDVANIPAEASSYQFVGTEAGDRAGYVVESAGDVEVALESRGWQWRRSPRPR